MSRFMSAPARKQYDRIIDLTRECGYTAAAYAEPDLQVGQDGPYDVALFRNARSVAQEVAPHRDMIPTVLARLLVKTVRDLHLNAATPTFQEAMSALDTPEGLYALREHVQRNADADLILARSQRQALSTLAEADLTGEERKDVAALTRTLGARLDREIAHLETVAEEARQRSGEALDALR
jgi:hypothetical protein